jgi:fatty acid-binding protein DegV
MPDRGTKHEDPRNISTETPPRHHSDGALCITAVLHADCSDVDAFVERLRPLTDGEIVVGQIGPVIGAHAGRGTIGVAFHERT